MKFAIGYQLFSDDSFLKNPDNLHALFDYTGFIRPEDIYLYEELFPAMKLATRVNANPVRILRAYIDNQKHVGSTLDLLEPNHTAVIYPRFKHGPMVIKSLKAGKHVYSAVPCSLRIEEINEYLYSPLLRDSPAFAQK